MRLILVGAVQSSWHALDELIKQGLKPVLVCTLRLDLATRHSDFTDLRPLAQDNDIPVLEVNNINAPEVLAHLRSLEPDYILVFGWSQLLKDDLLNLPRHGCLGLHPSLLPKNRGRALLPWTILSGTEETGVSVFFLDEGVDSGDIVAQRRIDVAPDETAQSLYEKVACSLREIITSDMVPLLKDDKPLPAYPQEHAQATYYAMRVPSDGWIDWQQSAYDIWTLIRAAGKPYPGAFTVYRDQRVIIWQSNLREDFNHTGVPGQILTRNDDLSVTVQCGQGWLDVVRVQNADGDELLAARFFKKVHVKLGIAPFELWEKVQKLSHG
jgi:methionyl-tRNA formyltransferase